MQPRKLRNRRESRIGNVWASRYSIKWRLVYPIQVSRTGNINTFHNLCPHLSSYNSTYFDGLVQEYSISIANALEILQSCPKPSIWNRILAKCNTSQWICMQFVVFVVVLYWSILYTSSFTVISLVLTNAPRLSVNKSYESSAKLFHSHNNVRYDENVYISNGSLTVYWNEYSTTPLYIPLANIKHK